MLAGKWTVQQAAEMSVAAPTIEASLDGRFVSGLKDERVKAAKFYEQFGVKGTNPVGELLLGQHCCAGAALRLELVSLNKMQKRVSAWCNALLPHRYNAVVSYGHPVPQKMMSASNNVATVAGHHL